MSLRDQFVAEFDVVEDFPVKRNPKSILCDRHRLMPAGQVNDAQPGVGEPYRTMTVDPDIVRTSIADGPDHVSQLFPIDRSTMQLKTACYAAHRIASPPYNM
jgi:hypothetical protein